MVRTDDKVALGIMRRSEARQIQEGKGTKTMLDFEVKKWNYSAPFHYLPSEIWI